MALRYGMPYLLVDTTGRLSGTQYNEMYDRMKYMHTRRICNDVQTVYDIYNYSEGAEHQSLPVATLYFGPHQAFGSVQYRNQQAKNMERYLSQVNASEGSRLRRFIASDGREYRWGWRKVVGDEWTCTNSDGVVIADYSHKVEGEPAYSTSGSMFTVTEEYAHLATEMLATVTIMRHIIAYNL